VECVLPVVIVVLSVTLLELEAVMLEDVNFRRFLNLMVVFLVSRDVTLALLILTSVSNAVTFTTWLLIRLVNLVAAIAPIASTVLSARTVKWDIS
jgi:hypothetical protein